jgi:hypothetical protein
MLARLGARDLSGGRHSEKLEAAALLGLCDSCEALASERRVIADRALWRLRTVGDWQHLDDNWIWLAASFGDRALYDALIAALARLEPGSPHRPVLARALGRFNNPELLERALRLVKDGGLTVREQDILLLSTYEHWPSRRRGYQFLLENQAMLIQRLGAGRVSELIAWLGESACDEASAKEVFARFRHPPMWAAAVRAERAIEQCAKRRPALEALFSRP